MPPRVGEPRPRPTPTPVRTPSAKPAATPRQAPAQQPRSAQGGRSGRSEFVQRNTTWDKLAGNAANASGIPSGLAGLSPRTPPNLNLGLARANAAGAIVAVPLAVKQAADDISAARNQPNQGNIAKATGSAIGVPRNVAAAAGAVFSVSQARTYRASYRAAEGALRTAMPGASASTVRAASRAAAETSRDALTQGIRRGAPSVINRAARSGVGTAINTAVRNQGTLRTAVGAGTRGAARAQLRAATNGAARAATTAAVRTGAGTIGRAAARFAPGVNVAVAAMDVSIAAATWANPNSSRVARATSLITAAGSIAAATNIPGVSQAGAAISTVSSFVGGLFD